MKGGRDTTKECCGGGGGGGAKFVITGVVTAVDTHSVNLLPGLARTPAEARRALFLHV